MREHREILTENERRFSEIATKIMLAYGFLQVLGKTSWSENNSPDLLMQRGDYTYCLECKYSRGRFFSSRSAVAAAERMLKSAEKKDWLPLVVVGGEMPVSLRVELANVSNRTIAVDIANLLYMAQEDRELYDELVALLPYAVDDLPHKKPVLTPVLDWNSAYGENSNWRVSTAPITESDRHRSVALVLADMDDVSGTPESLLADEWDGENSAIQMDDWEDDFIAAEPNSAPIDIDFGNGFFDVLHAEQDGWTAVSGSMGHLHGNPETGESDRFPLFQLELQRSNEELCGELESWKGGKHASQSTQYEKLCTRTLKRLFADDLTLWNEQAKSNSYLYRFDLICKIKRDNRKDFWEMAERYFESKYIIFEFKNYGGKVTQKAVYTTARYLYPTALRRVAIIISPNGIDEHAHKAIRGALRDEGKLILSLTNAELIHMLQMQDDGENPADYLSDKLDALLIDLEK